jgi:uncharacterized membrane protein YeaQ/YmgE (transglycosylase-associated protein family)
MEKKRRCTAAFSKFVENPIEGGGLMHLILMILVGAAAGWLAGKVMKGKGFGFWGNLGVGILGALVGGFLFGILGISVSALLGELVMAFVGAVVLLWIVGRVKKSR